jgi:hypothetical protein
MLPKVYYGGWEEYRVVGFRENDYKRLFEELSQLGPLRKESFRKRASETHL